MALFVLYSFILFYGRKKGGGRSVHPASPKESGRDADIVRGEKGSVLSFNSLSKCTRTVR